MDEIARSVNILYERYPYPSLPIRSERDLVNKLHANVMSKILSTAGLEPRSLCGKEVLDLSSSSLEAGRRLAEKFKLKVDFNKCDIAEFKTEKKFDHIFCLGVLHHTSGPYMRFRVLAGLCKPGGTITVGLYNRYGRFIHRARRLWIKLNAGEDILKRLSFVEASIYRGKFKNTHEQAFAADKYANPYESYHTVGDVIGWFNKNNITYIGSHPRTGTGKLQTFLSELKWLFKRNGFFIISGRKN